MNIKKFAQGSIQFLCLFCLGVAVTACLHPAPQQISQLDEVDSLLICKYDSIFTHPIEMEQRLDRAQLHISDSAAFYKLQLFKGFCRYLQGDFDTAVKINNLVLDFTQRTQNTALEAICWNHRSALLQNKNQRDSIIACLHHAYNALYRSEHRKELENICINLADQYRQKGELANAVRYYRKALWVVDSLQSERVRFSIYVGLGQIYADLHNFKLAHHYFNLAKNNPEPRPEYDNYFYYNSLGNCYYFEEHYDSALPCFRQAYAIGQKFRQPSIDALVEANMGEIFTLLKQYDSAHVYLDKSYHYFSHYPTTNDEVIFYLNSLKASLALREGNLTLMYKYLSLPYEADRIGPSYMYLHHKRFMEYYAQKKDYRQAFYYKKLVDTYDDSIRNVRSLNNIAEIDFRYRQDTMLIQRNVQIAQAKTQLSQQHILMVLICAALVILLLLIVLYTIYIRRKRDKEYMQQFALVTRLRMENVKNRLSPHYIYNVLNTVMPIVKQYTDLSHVMQLFIQVLRDNLQISNQIAVSLSEEISLVKNYIALRKETHLQTPSVEWEIGQDVFSDTPVPSMCIQIPIENALKYAFLDWEEEKQRPQIRVIIKREKQGILILTKDNGRGFDPGLQGNHERGTGNGLKILYRTAEVLNSKNTEKLNITIQTKSLCQGPDHGTVISVYIPDNYQFDL